MRKLLTFFVTALVSSSAMAHQVHGPIDNFMHTLSAIHHGSPLLTFGVMASVVGFYLGHRLLRGK